jgi:hypothetical protein
MQSYGDVLLSAVIHTPTEKHRTEVTLYEALRRKHEKSKAALFSMPFDTSRSTERHKYR